MKRLALFLMLLLAAAPAGAPAQAPAPEPVPTLSPAQTLARIRQQFRSHRPPPLFESYTIERNQRRSDGYPDVAESYTFHVWVRNSDRAAMKRKVFRDNYEYPPEFDRPAFNEPRDPGPPTADVFEPKPVRSHPVSEPYTPEPAQTQPPIIGRISALVELDYRVSNVQHEGKELHLTLQPLRDPDRNRLRELFCDAETYELTRLIATDTLFVQGDRNYGALFTLTISSVNGVPVVSRIHGVIGDGYAGDGQQVDFYFRDITFPKTLPEWYFNARQYGAHTNEYPQ